MSGRGARGATKRRHAPAEWAPDPTHRHRLRYHDAAGWTEWASDSGPDAAVSDLVGEAELHHRMHHERFRAVVVALGLVTALLVWNGLAYLGLWLAAPETSVAISWLVLGIPSAVLVVIFLLVLRPQRRLWAPIAGVALLAIAAAGSGAIVLHQQDRTVALRDDLAAIRVPTASWTGREESQSHCRSFLGDLVGLAPPSVTRWYQPVGVSASDAMADVAGALASDGYTMTARSDAAGYDGTADGRRRAVTIVLDGRTSAAASAASTPLVEVTVSDYGACDQRAP